MTSVLSALQYVAAYVAAGIAAAAAACALGFLINRSVKTLRERSGRRKRFSRGAGHAGSMSKGVQVGVSLTMISDEALASPDQIHMLSAWLAAHGVRPDDLMHILVPRTMCHDLRVARTIAAATVVQRVQDLYIAGPVLSFTDVIEPYLKWAKANSLLPEDLSSATLYDRTPARESSRTCPQAKEYEVALETSKRRRFVSSLVESDGLLFLRDQLLASQLKNSCVGNSALKRGRRHITCGCVKASGDQ